MILSFKLSNICGCSYKGGNVLFAPNKNILFSAVGNKISIIDLERNIMSTPSIECRKDISKIAISPDAVQLILVDEEGYAVIINTITNKICNLFNFKKKIKDIKYSPDGKFLAVCSDNELKIYERPSLSKSIEPLLLYNKYKGRHSGEITSLEWSPDSRFIITNSKDLSVKIHSIHHLKDFTPFSFVGHKDVCVKSFFENDMSHVYTIGKEGKMLVWKFVDDYLTNEYQKFNEYQNFKSGKKIKLTENQSKKIISESEPQIDQLYYSEFEKKVSTGRFILKTTNDLCQNTKIISAEFHYQSGYLLIAMKTGEFTLYSLSNQQLSALQTFSITSLKITTVAFNPSANWLAFGISSNSQLMVWEWRSQTYIYNQQGQAFDLSCLDYSNNGQIIATGGNDGRVRLWDSKSYFGFASFNEHSSKVSAIKFSPKGNNTVVSASLDGTIRAYDTIRYRNFRTMKGEIPCQFTCLAIDISGDIICAGSFDPYLIHCWNLQTGNLLETLNGHEGPVNCISFSPIEGILISGSWDKTVKLWDLYARNRAAETLDHTSEITAICYRPDGLEICVATLQGELYLWDTVDRQIRGVLDCRKDLEGGRIESDGGLITSKKDDSNKYFQCLCYSADGDYVLAGGKTKFVCLYEVKHRILLKRFSVTENRSWDGMVKKLSGKNLKDGVNLTLIDDHDDSDYNERKDMVLPGAKKPNYMKRNVKLRMEVKDVKFSPNGKTWAVASIEGISIFSAEDNKYFTPYELDETINAENVVEKFINGDYLTSLLMACKINEKPLLKKVFLNIPSKNVIQVAAHIPLIYLEDILTMISETMDNEYFEKSLIWLENLVFYFSDILKSGSMTTVSIFRSINKTIKSRFGRINPIANENIYTLEYLINNLKNIA